MKNEYNYGLDEFQAFLKKQRTIPENQIQYYLRWVDMLLARHNYITDDVTQETVKTFLDDLVDEKAPEWQVVQAARSIDFYFTRFLSIILPEKPVSWNIILSAFRKELEEKDYAVNTVKSYTKWCRNYAEFVHPLKPHRTDDSTFKEFLNHLTIERQVAPQTQNQAIKAVSLMYRDILNIKLDIRYTSIRAKTPKHLPVTMSVEDIRKLCNEMKGQNLLMVKLIYGSGLTLSECISLRIGDFDFKEKLIYVSSGTGRHTLLPRELKKEIKAHIRLLEKQHRQDLTLNISVSHVPEERDDPFDRQLQWFFPSDKIALNKQTGTLCRKHVFSTSLQKAIKRAAERAGIDPYLASPQVLRHSFAVAMLSRCNIRELQELLGHKDVRNTMLYEKLVAPGPYAGMWNPSEDLD